MSDEEITRLVAVVDAYFHPEANIVDAADAAAKIKSMRPDLTDTSLAKILRISETSLCVLNRVARAKPEQRERIKGRGVIAAYELLREGLNPPSAVDEVKRSDIH